MGERGVHEISTMVYVNAQFGVPVSHTWNAGSGGTRLDRKNIPTYALIALL